MILSAQTIRRLRPVEPFIEATKIHGMTAGLSHCGYDIRIKQRVLLRAGDFALASTVERFTMPLDVAGTVHDKSTWARRGIAVQNTFLEPGWFGWLTIEITNHSDEWVEIAEGSPIAQVVFHRVDEPVEPYRGKYSDQPDRPVEAILEAANDPVEVSCGCHACTDALKRFPTRMIVCPTCGNKRCPKASDHRFSCTGSNELGQTGSIYGGGA